VGDSEIGVPEGEKMNLTWIALALGIATTLVSYVSSAGRANNFTDSLRYGLSYVFANALFTAAIFSGLFYILLWIGKLILSLI
jgi:hypothetical protein